MKDELVTHNTAELAKQKGFNEPCYWISDLIYGAVENDHWHCNSKINIKGDASLYVTLPTQALLQRWLREVHNIHVDATFKADIINSTRVTITKTVIEDEWWTTAQIKKWKVVYNESFPIKDDKYDFNIKTYNDEKYKVETFTYEQALEAGLFHALTLIENEKSSKLVLQN